MKVEDVDLKLQTVMGYLTERGSGTYQQISLATNLSVRQIQRLTRKSVENGMIVKSKVGREIVLTLRHD